MELLAPAGSKEALHAAIKGGADAVYLGGTRFSARQYAKNFDNRQLEESTDYCHRFGVKIYVTVNTLLSNDELEEAADFIGQIHRMGVDGVIIQDLGLLHIIRQAFPGMAVHASTQMTTHNTQGVKALEEMGFKRVVLARELSIEEITRIAAETGIELEVFVHGALCLCYSGQCLMSSLIGGRSGNRGCCAQPCRMAYTLMDREGNKVKTQGRYLLSARDICTLSCLAGFKRAGVTSLKIEGRMKKPEYVSLVTSAYRKAIDSLDEATNMQDDMDKLMLAYNRGGFWPGYAFDNNIKQLIAPEKPDNWGLYIGRVKRYDGKTGRLVLKLAGDIKLGDGIEIWQDSGNSTGMVIKSIHLN
ncbi:MAG: peptidase U32 family protein, partial [Mahellales bacterium]